MAGEIIMERAAEINLKPGRSLAELGVCFCAKIFVGFQNLYQWPSGQVQPASTAQAKMERLRLAIICKGAPFLANGFF